MKTLKLSMLACAALMIGITSCEKDDATDSVPPVSKTDSIRVTFDAKNGSYTLFSFNDGKVVEQKDSASTKWDFGMKHVNIIVNSHSSGPGNAGAITQSGLFESYTQAPESGYAYDTTTTQKAINTSLNDGWYNYNPATHSFTPKAGKFFVIRTADNHYVKMELLSADYEPFTGQRPEWLIYKFRYTYQSDGSTNLK